MYKICFIESVVFLFYFWWLPFSIKKWLLGPIVLWQWPWAYCISFCHVVFIKTSQADKLKFHCAVPWSTHFSGLACITWLSKSSIFFFQIFNGYHSVTEKWLLDLMVLWQWPGICAINLISSHKSVYYCDMSNRQVAYFSA